MPSASSTPLDMDKAREIWAQYQRQHDVSDRVGQAVGVDPVSGRIWFERKALEIARHMRAEGIDRPFYCVRVGSDYYGRKGGPEKIRGMVSAEGIVWSRSRSPARRSAAAACSRLSIDVLDCRAIE